MTTIKTVFEAEMSGTLAAMSSNAKREVPAEFAQRTATREAWEEAFDKMRQSLRGTPVEAPKKPSKPKQTVQDAPKVVEPEEPQEPETPKTMDDIFLELHPEAREYA